MSAPLNAPPGPPYGSWPPPPPAPAARRWRTGAVAGIAAAALVIGAGAGAGIYATVSSSSAAPAPVAVPNTSTTQGHTDIADSAAAQQKTCEVLRTGYKPLAAAIDNMDRFKNRPWSDPELLASVAALVGAADQLSSDLEHSLSPSAPEEFGKAIQNYVTGLRAVSITEGSHASNVQENGVAKLYNQVVDVVLPMCGIPS